jgi:hypothetical protein
MRWNKRCFKTPKMKPPIKFGDRVSITRDDNYCQTFKEKAIATGKVFIEVLRENGLKEHVDIERITREK